VAWEELEGVYVKAHHYPDATRKPPGKLYYHFRHVYEALTSYRTISVLRHVLDHVIRKAKSVSVCSLCMATFSVDLDQILPVASLHLKDGHERSAIFTRWRP